MEPLLPLSDIEQLPEFIESPPERKAEIYDNYFTRRKAEAATEDDYNLLLKEQADRNRNSVKMQIEVNHPFLDKPEYLPKEIQDQVAKIHAMDQEFKFNQEEAKPEEFRATDMEDPNRSLKIKPFKYDGQQGYSIKYPNGDVESVPGVSTKAQLTEYLKTKNDKFNGKREGVFDKLNPLAESELEGIINSINQVSSGVEGAFNQAAKTIQSMGQGLMLDDIDEIKQAANEYSDAESTIIQLDPQIAAEERKINEFGRGDKMRLAELKQERDAAAAIVSTGKRNSYETVAPILKEKYKELIDSVNESNKIGGAKVLDDYNRYLQSLPEAQRGDASAFTNYFKDKPAQLLPYIATTAIAASPDIALGLGSSLAAGAVGGPAAAAATGQAVGYQREYTATLLSEMQLRAAKDNKQLTPETLNSYLDNPEFMDQVRNKAQTRGAVIGAADAVLGGAAQKVVESTINGTVKKALLGGAIGAVTEGAGEGLAQVASGDKANFTEIFNEAIGGLGATAVAAPAAMIDNSIKGKKIAKTAEIQEKVKQRVEAAQFFGHLKTPVTAAERVDKMKEMLPPVPRVIDKTAFEGEAEAPFAGPVESGLDGKQGFPKAAQKPFAAQEQKPLSGQAQRPFVGEAEQGLTEDAPVIEPPAAPPIEPVKEEVQLTEKKADDVFAPEAYKEVGEGFKSRKKIVSMPIKDFLKLAEPIKGKARRPEAKESFDKGIKWNSIPELQTEKGGKVTTHEGRHRAEVLLEAGYTHMPVAINDRLIRWSEADPASVPTELTSEVGNDKVPMPELINGNYPLQLTENTPTPEVETTAEVPHLPGEVNQETKDLASVATTTEEKETVAKQAKQDIADNRFNALKSEYPELLNEFVYDGKNIQEAREIVTNHLEESFDKVDAEGKEVSEAKRAQAAKLQVNLRLALNILPEKIKETNMTESQVDHVLNAMEYIMEATKDIPSMTANKMRYFNNVLSSFADGGALVGMKGVITKTFISKWKGILDEVMGQGAIFDKPIAPVRNGPFFNLFSGTVGTMASFAHEVSHIGRNEVAHAFVRDLMGVFKDNIDFKQLEERAVVEDWYQHLNKKLPKISNQSDHMIGIAARLTQWDRASKTSPLEQMIKRNSQLTESFSDAQPVAGKGKGALLAYNKKQAAIVKQSYDALMSGIDLATFPDEAAAVAAIEARLSPEQLSVLNKTRDMGKAFLPFLQNVKAVTKNAKLQDFANYVHDSNITPNEAGESHSVKEVSSMSDVLHERIGIDPQTGYPETSIRAIAEHQAKASTYEKHTGVERYLFRQLMADKQFTNILDSFDKSRGISERLLKISEVYNESMTKNQPRGNAVISFVEGAFSLVAGSLIFGLNNTIKNFTAAAIARLSLVGLGNEALGNFTLYDQNMTQINKFLKQHVPTQYHRTSQYDVVEGSDTRYSFRNKKRLEKELGKSSLAAFVSALPHLPHSAVNNIQKHIFSRLGNYSNALPERQNAFAIWTAAYIHYAQQNGTVIDGQDFLARMPHDKRAANDANDFTTKALGYAPDKASKGSFWNGSTRTKQIISKTLFGFMQQATGLAVTAQNELVKAGRLFRSGDYKEGAKALAVSSLAISNIIMFRAMTLALQGVVLYPVLTQYFNGSDDEEKKKSVLKVKKSYEDTAARSNLGAMYKDVASALFPAYGAAPLVTGAFNMGMDMAGAVATPNPEDGPLDLGIEFKKNLKTQSTEITEQLKDLDKRIKFAEKMGLQDRPEFDQMLKEEEKLMAIKDEITKKLQFSYTTGDKEKAVLGPWGMYGIGMEYVTKQIKSFMEDDLTTDEQKELDRLLKEQVTYNDPMAEGFLNGIVEKPYSLLRLLSSGEFGRDKKDQVPTEIHMLKLLKLGQNPAVVLERARRELATIIAKKNLEQDRRVRELQQKLK